MKKTTLLIALFILVLSPFTQAQKKGKKETKAPIDEINISGLKWRSIGPSLTSGRISDIAINPDNPFEYYVATSSGGVWKTVNSGVEYLPIFDSEGSYSIGCITIDPSNPQNQLALGFNMRT